MAFTLPRVSALDITSYYRMIKFILRPGYIYLPCACLDGTETAAWQAPVEPVDSNIFVGDCTWQVPLEQAYNVFVRRDDYRSFNALVKMAFDKGYTFGIYSFGHLEDDMVLIGLQRTETPDVNSGYMVQLSFRKIIRAEAKIFELDGVNVASPKDASTLAQGTAAPTAKPLKSTLAVFDDALTGWLPKIKAFLGL